MTPDQQTTTGPVAPEKPDPASQAGAAAVAGALGDAPPAAEPPHHGLMTRLRDAFAALEGGARNLHNTLGQVPAAQQIDAPQRAEHGHAVQLADEAIKGLEDMIQTLERAAHRLNPFAQP